MTKNPNEYKDYNLQMNHVIDSITFGPTINQASIKKNFGHVDNGTHTIFNMFHKDGKVNENLKNEVEDKSQSYFYFMKLVPHVFVDKVDSDARNMNSYSYSLNHNKKESAGSPSMTIILDYAPVNMILIKEKKHLGDISIEICSIIGGVFVMFGLINSMCLNLRNKIK